MIKINTPVTLYSIHQSTQNLIYRSVLKVADPRVLSNKPQPLRVGVTKGNLINLSQSFPSRVEAWWPHGQCA